MFECNVRSHLASIDCVIMLYSFNNMGFRLCTILVSEHSAVMIVILSALSNCQVTTPTRESSTLTISDGILRVQGLGARVEREHFKIGFLAPWIAAFDDFSALTSASAVSIALEPVASQISWGPLGRFGPGGPPGPP